MAFLTCFSLLSQEKQDPLPFRQIPDAPESYAPGNVIARTIDGLGYRFYWATEGLTETDLTYKPSAEGRTSEQTIKHIFDLSEMIKKASFNEPNDRAKVKAGLSFEEMRTGTLWNLKSARDNFSGKTDKELEGLHIIFQAGENKSEFPVWNLLNGPLADAIWHTGQIVLMRRSSGNPLPEGVNVFLGKTRE